MLRGLVELVGLICALVVIIQIQKQFALLLGGKNVFLTSRSRLAGCLGVVGS